MGIVSWYDPFKVIRAALSSGGDFAEVYVEDSAATSITLEEDKIEKVISGRDMGAGIRVIADYRTYFAYTNDLTEKTMLEVASTLSKAVKDGKAAASIDLRDKKIAPGFAIKKFPADFSLEEKIALVNAGNKTARAFDKRIRQVKVVYGDGVKKTAVVNSLGEWREEERASILYLCQTVAVDGAVIQTGYEPVGGVLGMEVFDENPPEKIA